MYSILDVASLIIEFFNSKKITISNITLQKVLLYIWKVFKIEKDRFLFDEIPKMERVGVIFPTVYKEYCFCGAFNIFEPLFTSTIKGQDREFIEKELDFIIEQDMVPVIEFYEKASKEYKEKNSFNLSSLNIKNEVKRNKIFEYYYIENMVSEYHSSITGEFKDFESAKEGLKTRSDWYCDKGTGKIIKVEFFECEDGSLRIDKKIVFEK